MAWKCNDCGFEANLDAAFKCDACGHSEATILTLTSQATGENIEMRIATDVGKQLLDSFVGEESRFASKVQFCCSRDSDTGDWTVQHESTASNPTFLDLQPLESVAVLREGSVLSIGPERVLLTVGIKK